MVFDLPRELLELQATVSARWPRKGPPRAREIDTQPRVPHDLFEPSATPPARPRIPEEYGGSARRSSAQMRWKSREVLQYRGAWILLLTPPTGPVLIAGNENREPH